MSDSDETDDGQPLMHEMTHLKAPFEAAKDEGARPDHIALEIPVDVVPVVPALAEEESESEAEVEEDEEDEEDVLSPLVRADAAAVAAAVDSRGSGGGSTRGTPASAMRSTRGSMPLLELKRPGSQRRRGSVSLDDGTGNIKYPGGE